MTNKKLNSAPSFKINPEVFSIEIENLSLHKPTLDDVFLQFTGHQAVKEEEEKTE
jgi:hypothetical protein